MCLFAREARVCELVIEPKNKSALTSVKLGGYAAFALHCCNGHHAEGPVGAGKQPENAGALERRSLFTHLSEDHRRFGIIILSY